MQSKRASFVLAALELSVPDISGSGPAFQDVCSAKSLQC